VVMCLTFEQEFLTPTTGKVVVVIAGDNPTINLFPIQKLC